MWEQAQQDLRHAFRGLSHSRSFVAVALISLALGIGVNTAIFTLVNGILLKNLPVADPHRIVQIKARLKTFDSSAFNFPLFRELRRQDAIFSNVTGFSGRNGMLETAGDPRRVDYEFVTGSYLAFFGARPALGRLIDEEDDRVEGAHRVCVLSFRAWHTHFGGDPGILNRTIRMDGVPVQVVGVAAPDFVGAELQRRYDLWLPTALLADFSNARESPNYIWLRILARLKPGITFGEAQARLEGASRAIEEALPKDRANAHAVYRIVDASKGFDSWRTPLHDPLFILMGAVTLVLLVACANLANLVLARTSERYREFAIKLSLGISRGRLLRQLLVETLLLAVCGGAAALLLSLGLTRYLLALFNAGSRYQTLQVAPDRSVFLYTFGVSVLTAFIAGVYPAWQASRADAGAGLKGASFHGLRRSFVRRGLILVQVTLAVVLLFGASLFAHSLGKLKVVNLGYEIDRVLTVDIGPKGPAKSFRPVKASPALAAVLNRVRQLPGVESAAFSTPGVLSGGMMSSSVTVKESGRQMHDVSFLFAGAGYFSTMRIPLLAGRAFTAADRPDSPPVAIVNQQLASALWPGQNPIGQHFDGWGIKNLEIIGIAGNTKYQNIREKTRPIVFQAFEQMPERGGALEIRFRGVAAAVERDIRQIVKSAAPDYQVSNLSAMELMRDSVIAQDRLLAFLSTLFGMLGTALALVGIYGLISYSVSRRTREIGIRMSVGARPGDVLWLFLRESLMLVVAGVLIGLPLALDLARYLGKLLYQVSTSDPLGIGITLVLLTLGGAVASYLPGRRAARVNPVQALRYD
jgi:predicted permease